MKKVYVCYIWDYSNAQDYPNISEPKAIFDSEEKAKLWCYDNTPVDFGRDARYWDYEVQ